MAVIVRVKGSTGNRWRVRVRKKGHDISRNFLSSTSANSWARDVEVALDEANPRKPFRASDWLNIAVYEGAIEQHQDDNAPPLPNSLLRAVIGKYVRKHPDLQKSNYNRLMAWTRHAIAGEPFEGVSPETLQKHIDERGRKGIAANTTRNDVFALSAVFSFANEKPKAGDRGGWGMNVVNPCELVELPVPGDSRERRLWKGEEEALKSALAKGPDPLQMLAIFNILVETGMRLGEVRDLLPSWLVETQGGTRYLSLPSSNTKTNKKRNVVVSKSAAVSLSAILTARKEGEMDLPFFTLDIPKIEYRWKMARSLAKIKDLHLHDLRHEALSRMAERGFTITELQNQSGHKSVKILMRYLHANVDKISEKMG